MSAIFKTLKPLLVLLAGVWILVGCEAGPPPTNLAPAKAKAAQCVEPTADIRKNHMAYLMQHRDATVLAGIRSKQYSLVECINCHVDPKRADGSAVHYEDRDHFCASCHTYVGVKIDCFQCHADRPELANQTNYQHKLGSAESYHFSHQLGTPAVLSLQDLQTITSGGVQ
ncbi:hypothetical protein [Thiofilum flexile]|uniref:hypothetical protein n=1 Tax=Thiofilum flexile TaxID=125627 RepID=UPI00036F3FCC|nr:hypothetical protein [Thiofilum flexile]